MHGGFIRTNNLKKLAFVCLHHWNRANLRFWNRRTALVGGRAGHGRPLRHRSSQVRLDKGRHCHSHQKDPAEQEVCPQVSNLALEHQPSHRRQNYSKHLVHKLWKVKPVSRCFVTQCELKRLKGNDLSHV